MLRLLLWTIIWMGQTGVSTQYPCVFFPEQLSQYPYFPIEHVRTKKIKSISIYTSVKFPEREMYKLSQYHVLNYGREGQLLGKKVIFEALTDTLQTVISWNEQLKPSFYLENTGRQWEYAALEWKEHYPTLIKHDSYENRDASSIEALKILGNNFKNSYWTTETFGNKFSIVIHDAYGTPHGQLWMTPPNRPEEFYYNENQERRSYRYRYAMNPDNSIQSMRSGGRINQRTHEFTYDEKGKIKGVRTMLNNEIESLTDYFYNDDETLRSILQTDIRTKEMTVKEFRYSFY